MRAVAFITRLLLRLFYRIEVRGTLESHERVLMVSNHQSFLDGIILGAVLPVMPLWLVHTSHARRWYGKLLRLLPHLAIDTNSPMAIKTIVSLVETGKPVLIFPEGRITVTGGIMKIYDGPAFVAARTGATVVPIHIDGPIYTHLSRMSGDFPKKLFPKVRVTLCRPRTLPMPEGRTARIRRRKASEQLRRIMQEAAIEARRDISIYESFLDAVKLYGRSRRILEDVQRTYTYRDLLKASLALGRILRRTTEEGERVGMLLPNVGPAVGLLLAMFATRRVPAILNFTSGLDGMQNAIRLANVKLVLTSRGFMEKSKLGPTVEKLEGVRVVYLEDVRAMLSTTDKLWLIAWAMWFPRSVAARVSANDPAAILFTSGSEAMPKGVMLSHKSILVNIDQLKATIDFTSKDKFLSALPVFHSFGLTVGTILPLLYGCKIIYYPTPLHYRIIPELVYDRDCTVVCCTNTFLAGYLRTAHTYDFRSVRVLVVGAEKLTEDVRQAALDKFGQRVLEGYGVTECSPGISANIPLSYRRGTLGQVFPGMEYRIEPVPGIDEGGLLHVRGPNVMLGYLRADKPGTVEPPSSLYGPGWYNTGDVVTVDEDGYITIVGRMRRFAKVAGEMISLEVVERIAVAASPERQHAAVAVEESGRGETVVLFTEDAALRREKLQSAAREIGAPEIAIPRRIVQVGKMPLLGNGKKDYVTLNKTAREQSQTALRG